MGEKMISDTSESPTDVPFLGMCPTCLTVGSVFLCGDMLGVAKRIQQFYGCLGTDRQAEGQDIWPKFLLRSLPSSPIQGTVLNALLEQI